MGKYGAHGAPAQHWVITGPPLQQLDSTSHRFQLSIRLFTFWSLLPFVLICVLWVDISVVKNLNVEISYPSASSVFDPCWPPMCWSGISSWKIWTLKFVFGRALLNPLLLLSIHCKVWSILFESSQRNVGGVICNSCPVPQIRALNRLWTLTGTTQGQRIEEIMMTEYILSL